MFSKIDKTASIIHNIIHMDMNISFMQRSGSLSSVPEIWETGQISDDNEHFTINFISPGALISFTVVEWSVKQRWACHHPSRHAHFKSIALVTTPCISCVFQWFQNIESVSWNDCHFLKLHNKARKFCKTLVLIPKKYWWNMYKKSVLI